jgi:hypothetical protein
VKGRDALAEIVGAAQPAVALVFELDRQRQAVSSMSFISFFALRCANGGKPRSSSASASLAASSSPSATQSANGQAV